MSRDHTALRSVVEEEAGVPVRAIRPFAAGRDAYVLLIDLDDKRRLVAKIARQSPGRMDLEGWMLTYLKQKSRLPVPRVFAANADMLIMAYIPEGGPALGRMAEEEAADQIAALHDVTGTHYGLERDTMIGGLPQENRRSQDWATFFRDRRLLPFARAAREEGRIDSPLMKRIEKLAARVPALIGEAAPPSLIHGDLWAGNVLALNGRISGYIDPAVYYADAEMELAFLMLFRTFGPDFFRRYEQKRPLRPGFHEVRKDLYNLFPLLVHIRLYGAGYRPPLEAILDRLAGQ